MKSLITILFIFCITFAFAQSGKIYLKDTQTVNGKETFVYKPIKGIALPENSKANVLSIFTNKSVPIQKVGNAYEFVTQISDSIRAIYFIIIDSKGNTVDDNFGKGYVVLLKNKNHDEIAKSTLEQLDLVRNANYFFKLDITSQDIVNQYEKLYAENPELKKGDSYVNYLSAKYDVDKDAIKPEMLSYAQAKAATGNENDMMMAYRIYKTLKIEDKCQEIMDLALQRYPTGDFAKMKFWNEFYMKPDKTVDNVKETMKQYETTFQDSSSLTKNRFNQFLVYLYLANKDTASIENLKDCDKLMIAEVYNNVAWNLSGEDLTSPGKDLDYAAALSKKSIDLIKNRMEHPEATDNPDWLETTYNNNADTYALILYKQGKYGEALHYEGLPEKKDSTNIYNKERYAAYAEKAKGAEFVRTYIESQLQNGYVSTNLLDQLHSIYQQLNLPESQFEAIKQKGKDVIAKNYANSVQKILGTTKATDFELTNLEGKTVKLSDYKGKLVVLDFWATWCRPCRASFPKMQEIVTKYKDNNNIEFFFIDCGEREAGKFTNNQIKEKVFKFIADNQYTFNVLFDFEDAVQQNYKVLGNQGIPCQIVIDKTGKIIAINPRDNLQTLIDKNI